MMTSSKTSIELNRVIRQALAQLFALQIHAGMSTAQITVLSRECLAEAQCAAQSQNRGDEIFDAQDYGSVLKSWHRQSQYLSPNGFPRPLALEGRYGLRRLVEKYYPKSRFLSIVGALRHAGLIRKQSNGMWIPTERSAVFPRLNPELLAHLSEGICRLIETMTKNVTSDRKDDALFERSTKVRALPVSEAIAFRQFVKNQGSAFLGAVDDWLEVRAESAKDRRVKKCTAGVFTFAFLDEYIGNRPRAKVNRRKGTAQS
jgi:hypothetical protein